MLTEHTDLTVLAQNLKKRVRSLMTVYGLLIVGTILLFLVVIAFVGLAGWAMYDSGRIYGRAIILLIGAIVVAGICVKVVLEPLFKIFEPRKNNGKEIKREDYPDLFAVIDEVVEKVDCLQPKHVYLSDECNAYVNYPSMWGYIFHGRQNLTIGIPLLFGMNKTELKSILSHEFGHFTQRSVKVNRIANLSEFICGAIAQSQEEIEKADDDTYEAKARWFARLATKIMVKQYHKVAPLNGVLSRAQEYDADRFSYEVVGSEGSLSALCKIQDLSVRWDRLFMGWLWDRIEERRQPERVWNLFTRFSAELDPVCVCALKPAIHFKPSLAEFDSRISGVENTDTHPSTNQRCIAIASYPHKETFWDNSPAFDYFPDSVIEEQFNRVPYTLSEKRFPETTEFLKKDVKDEELLSSFKSVTPVLFGDFFQDELFYYSEILEESDNKKEPVEYPFTRPNSIAIHEYMCAKEDYSILQRIVEENSAQRRFIYNGKEYTGTQVPIEEHRQYYAPLYERAKGIAVQSHCWIRGQIIDNDNLTRCFDDMIWMKQAVFSLENYRRNMEDVYYIGKNHDQSTKAQEYVKRAEASFLNVVSRYFEKDENGICLFGWMCDNLGVGEEPKKFVLDYMETKRLESVEDLYHVYDTITTVFSRHFDYNWRMVKEKVLLPYYTEHREEVNAL